MPIRVSTAFLAGKEPDVIFHNYLASTIDWQQDGVTIPLEDVLADTDLLSRFDEVPIAQYTNPAGHLVALPLEGFSWPIWYNTAIFDEAGVAIPTTADELVDAAAKIRAAGFQPLAVGGNDWTGFSLFTLIADTFVPHADSVELWSNGGFGDNEDFKRAVQEFTEWRDGGVFIDGAEGYNFDTQNAAFFGGEAAMMMGGSWSFSELPPERVDKVQLGGLPLPESAPLDNPAWYHEFTAKGVWVTRNGEAKLDGIKVFLDELFTPEQMAKFDFESPVTGTPISETLHPLFAEAAAVADGLDTPQIPDLNMPQAIYGDLYAVVQKAYIPGVSADEIVADLDALYATVNS
jgi:multiple sugar transport system substrate-binding protein